MSKHFFSYNLKAIIIGLSLFMPLSSYAYYALGASPTLPADQAKTIYEPIAQMLSEELGLEVEFHYDNDWQVFSKKVLSDEYHLIFSEPHVTAYLADIKSDLAMDAPLKLRGEIVFHVVVSDNNKATSLKTFGAERICMLPSPNFSGVLIKKEFSNPVVQPTVVAIKGNFDNVYKEFKKGACSAAVIDDESLKKQTEKGEKIRSIYTSQNTPNVSLAVSQRIPVSDRKLIIDSLTNSDNTSVLKAIHQAYDSEGNVLEPTSREEFAPFNILPGVVWGW